MDLKIKDLVELLRVSEKTIYRWIREKRLPAYRINHQFRFNKAEINAWLLQNRIDVDGRIFDLALTGLPVNLADMIARGGVHDRVPGATPAEVIRNAIRAIRLPAGADRDRVVEAVLLREGLMTTAVGRGIAIPHPRNPILTNELHSEVSICRLERPVDFNALDGRPVRTLFIVLAANAKRHLEILSKISYFCQQDDFRRLLEERRPAGEIVAYLARAEQELPARGKP